MRSSNVLYTPNRRKRSAPTDHTGVVRPSHRAQAREIADRSRQAEALELVLPPEIEAQLRKNREDAQR